MLLFVAGVAVFGVPAYLLFEREPIVAVLAGVVSACLVLAVVWEIRMVGTPALVIDDRGITTPNFGLVLWSEIDRLVVRVSDVKGMKIYWLLLSVHGPSKYFARLNTLSRWLKRLDVSSVRDVIPISLNLLSREAPYVEAVIEHVCSTYGLPNALDTRR